MSVTLTSQKLSVIFDPFGAEIKSVKNKNDVEFIWQGNKAVWARHAPVLFPIVGKLKDDTFSYEGKKYSLPQHGFARDMAFELVSQNSFSCVFRLSSNEETKNKYPFDFVFEIKYQLSSNTLTAFYTVKNSSEIPMHFSLGAHPGFNCPLLEHETFNDYYIKFETSEFKLTELSNGLRLDYQKALNLNNGKLPLTSSLFDNDAIVFENYQIHKLTLCSKISKHKIILYCQDWPNFGIWTKKGTQQFICLEPWYGIADSVNSDHELTSKKGIITLKPLGEFNCSYSLNFS